MNRLVRNLTLKIFIIELKNKQKKKMWKRIFNRGRILNWERYCQASQPRFVSDGFHLSFRITCASGCNSSIGADHVLFIVVPGGSKFLVLEVLTCFLRPAVTWPFLPWSPIQAENARHLFGWSRYSTNTHRGRRRAVGGRRARAPRESTGDPSRTHAPHQVGHKNTTRTFGGSSLFS